MLSVNIENNKMNVMNIIEDLRSKPFKTRGLLEQMVIVQSGRPKPDLREHPLYNHDTRSKQRFTENFYKNNDWIAGDRASGKLFCWYCILFPSSDCTDAWESDGIECLGRCYSTNDMHSAIKQHLRSVSHRKAQNKYDQFLIVIETNTCGDNNMQKSIEMCPEDSRIKIPIQQCFKKNFVDILVETRFPEFSLKEQLKFVNDGRPIPHLGNNPNTKMFQNLCEEFDWLTCSVVKMQTYCWSCLLFSEKPANFLKSLATSWIVTDFKSIFKSHEKCREHLVSSQQLFFFQYTHLGVGEVLQIKSEPEDEYAEKSHVAITKTDEFIFSPDHIKIENEMSYFKGIADHELIFTPVDAVKSEFEISYSDVGKYEEMLPDGQIFKTEESNGVSSSSCDTSLKQIKIEMLEICDFGSECLLEETTSTSAEVESHQFSSGDGEKGPITVIDTLVEEAFSFQTHEKQVEILKNGRPKPDIWNELPLKQREKQLGMQWYEVKKWLTANPSTKILYCWPCLLFSPKYGDYIKYLQIQTKHLQFQGNVNLHEKTSSHMHSIQKYNSFCKNKAFIESEDLLMPCKTTAESFTNQKNSGKRAQDVATLTPVTHTVTNPNASKWKRYENIVDELLEKPFSEFSSQERARIVKRGRPTPDLWLNIIPFLNERKFRAEWYNFEDWLTGSYLKRTAYCWPCLLFPDNLGKKSREIQFSVNCLEETKLVNMTNFMKMHVKRDSHERSCKKLTEFREYIDNNPMLLNDPEPEAGNNLTQSISATGSDEALIGKENIVDQLIPRPFSQRSMNERILIILNGRPMPEFGDIFNPKIYKSKEWLTASSVKQTAFCWPCLLFKTSTVATEGVKTRNLWSYFSNHHLSKAHLVACQRLEYFKEKMMSSTLDNLDEFEGTEPVTLKLAKELETRNVETLFQSDEDDDDKCVFDENLDELDIYSDLVDEILKKPITARTPINLPNILDRERPTPHLESGTIAADALIKWYTKFSWLTASQTRNRLYCWVCIIFPDITPFTKNEPWQNEGLDYDRTFDIVNLRPHLVRHSESAEHIDASWKTRITVCKQYSHVDRLLFTPFAYLKRHDKLEIIREGRSTPHFGWKKFLEPIYARFDWLTASVAKKTFYCWFCIMFPTTPFLITIQKPEATFIKSMPDTLQPHEMDEGHQNAIKCFNKVGSESDLDEKIDDTRRLISIVKKLPRLHNSDEESMSDEVDQLWKFIAIAIKKPASVCKQTWCQLKKDYEEHLKKSEQMSGLGLSSLSTKWEFENDMSFLFAKKSVKNKADEKNEQRIIALPSLDSEQFSKEDQSSLIWMISFRPALFDSNCNESDCLVRTDGDKMYKTNKDSWDQIGVMLNKPGLDCAKQWSGIRNKYNQYMVEKAISKNSSYQQLQDISKEYNSALNSILFPIFHEYCQSQKILPQSPAISSTSTTQSASPVLTLTDIEANKPIKIALIEEVKKYYSFLNPVETQKKGVLLIPWNLVAKSFENELTATECEILWHKIRNGYEAYLQEGISGNESAAELEENLLWLNPYLEAEIEFNRRLVEQVRLYPSLYTNNDVCSTTEFEEHIWAKIAQHLGTSSFDCQKKWKKLATDFFAMQKKKPEKLPKWALFNSMFFLDVVSPLSENKEPSNLQAPSSSKTAEGSKSMRLNITKPKINTVSLVTESSNTSENVSFTIAMLEQLNNRMLRIDLKKLSDEYRNIYLSWCKIKYPKELAVINAVKVFPNLYCNPVKLNRASVNTFWQLVANKVRKTYRIQLLQPSEVQKEWGSLREMMIKVLKNNRWTESNFELLALHMDWLAPYLRSYLMGDDVAKFTEFIKQFPEVHRKLKSETKAMVWAKFSEAIGWPVVSCIKLWQKHKNIFLQDLGLILPKNMKDMPSPIAEKKNNSGTQEESSDISIPYGYETQLHEKIVEVIQQYPALFDENYAKCFADETDKCWLDAVDEINRMGRFQPITVANLKATWEYIRSRFKILQRSTTLNKSVKSKFELDMLFLRSDSATEDNIVILDEDDVPEYSKEEKLKLEVSSTLSKYSEDAGNSSTGNKLSKSLGVNELFSKQRTSKLINTVKQYPILYNPVAKLDAAAGSENEAWCMVAMELGSHERLVKTAWKAIENFYYDALCRPQKCDKSGKNGDIMQEMEFLKPYVNQNSESDLPCIVIEDEEEYLEEESEKQSNDNDSFDKSYETEDIGSKANTERIIQLQIETFLGERSSKDSPNLSDNEDQSHEGQNQFQDETGGVKGHSEVKMRKIEAKIDSLETKIALCLMDDEQSEIVGDDYLEEDVESEFVIENEEDILRQLASSQVSKRKKSGDNMDSTKRSRIMND